MTSMMIEAAVRGLILAIVVGAGLGVLRVTNVPVRKAAWSLVLVASLAMPFLMRWPAITGLAKGVAWVVPIHRFDSLQRPARQPVVVPGPSIAKAAEVSPAGRLPVARARKRAMPAAMVPLMAQAANHRDPAADGAVPAIPVAAVPASMESATARHPWQWPPVERLIVWVYLAVSGALLLRLAWGLAAAVWLWARAEEISPLDVPEENVRVSARIPSPVTIGSGIVLPDNYGKWGRSKLRVVLAHERSHVRQLDFYLQLLAGLYTAIFWFSPLGWWLKRTLSHLGEAISDRAGLEAAASRSDYAGVLLEFAATAQRALPGVAMARRGNLSRRVDQLLNERLFQRAFAEGRRRAMASLLLVPAALFAVTALVRVQSASAQTQAMPQTTMPAAQQGAPQQPITGESTPPESQVTTMSPETVQSPAVPSAPQAVPATVPAPDAAPAAVPAPSQAVPAPEKPGAPQLPSAPPSDEDMPMTMDVGPMPGVKVPAMPDMKIVVPKSSMMLDGEMPEVMALQNLGGELSVMAPGDGLFLAPNGGMHGYAYYFSSNGDSWAIVDGAGKNFSLGSGSDKQSLDLAQRMAKGPFLWFSHDGKSYIVDDAAIVARVQSLYAPMKDLARQQEALGVQQRVMGRMDADVARQERTDANVKIPDLSKEMADAEAALNSLKSEQGQMLSEEKLAEMQAKLAEMEARLGTLRARSAREYNFGERMRALGEQQRQMGERERQLGEQEKTLATEAQQQVQSIIQECLRNGKAAQVKD
ncbi:MAG: M56 family metallopeptidase [Acidobacteriaceae bacterium]